MAGLVRCVENWVSSGSECQPGAEDPVLIQGESFDPESTVAEHRTLRDR